MDEFVKAKKSLGQHWLTDADTLNAICDFADIKPDDVVLEIGPGTGSLTRQLVKRAGQVIAVERDESLLDRLNQDVIAKNLQIIQGDILKFDLTQLAPGYKVVANIPYYLTSNLVRLLSESANPPKTAVLLVQREVAERLAAKPGNMSVLAVTAQFYWQVEAGIVVEAALFDPPPKVDSQVIRLEKRAKPLFEGVDSKRLFRLVKAGFSNRRKMLLNSLAGGLQMSKDDTRQMLEAAGIDAQSRPQQLSLEDWHALYLAQSKSPSLH